MLEVEVTQSDIDQGHKFCFYWCPIARAIQDKLAGGVITVTKTRVTVLNPDRVNVYAHSPQSYRFIEDFDLGRPVKPTKLKLYKAYNLCGYSWSPTATVVGLLWGMRILLRYVMQKLKKLVANTTK